MNNHCSEGKNKYSVLKWYFFSQSHFSYHVYHDKEITAKALHVDTRGTPVGPVPLFQLHRQDASLQLLEILRKKLNCL